MVGVDALDTAGAAERFEAADMGADEGVRVALEPRSIRQGTVGSGSNHSERMGATTARSSMCGGSRVQEPVRARLTTWFLDQRGWGRSLIRPPRGHPLRRGASPMRTGAKIERFFLALASVEFDPIGSFRLLGTQWTTNIQNGLTYPAHGLKITTLDSIQVSPLPEDRRWIHPFDGRGYYRLTAAGVDQLERLICDRTQFDQRFVAMWFGEQMSPVYDSGFEPAILDAGYKPMRIDWNEHNNKIDDEIITSATNICAESRIRPKSEAFLSKWNPKNIHTYPKTTGFNYQ